jgi:hypothetical protein
VYNKYIARPTKIWNNLLAKWKFLRVTYSLDTVLSCYIFGTKFPSFYYKFAFDSILRILEAIINSNSFCKVIKFFSLTLFYYLIAINLV